MFRVFMQLIQLTLVLVDLHAASSPINGASTTHLFVQLGQHLIILCLDLLEFLLSLFLPLLLGECHAVDQSN